VHIAEELKRKFDNVYEDYISEINNIKDEWRGKEKHLKASIKFLTKK